MKNYVILLNLLLFSGLLGCSEPIQKEHDLTVRVTGTQEEIMLWASYPTSSNLVTSKTDGNSEGILRFNSYSSGDKISVYLSREGVSIGQIVVEFPKAVTAITRVAEVGSIIEYDPDGDLIGKTAFR